MDGAIAIATDEEPPIASMYNFDHESREYRYCGEFKTPTYQGFANTIHCDKNALVQAVGRYMYLYQKSNGGYLCFCEVEVFGVREYYMLSMK